MNAVSALSELMAELPVCTIEHMSSSQYSAGDLHTTVPLPYKCASLRQ